MIQGFQKFIIMGLLACVCLSAYGDDARDQPVPEKDKVTVRVSIANRHPTSRPVMVDVSVVNSGFKTIDVMRVYEEEHSELNGIEYTIVGEGAPKPDNHVHCLFNFMPNGRVTIDKLTPGGTIKVCGKLPPLPAGKYEIIFKPSSYNPGKWAKALGTIVKQIEVVDDDELRKSVGEQLAGKIRAGKLSAFRLGLYNQIPEALAAIYESLSSDDAQLVINSINAMKRLYKERPEGLIPAIAAGLKHQLDKPEEEAGSQYLHPKTALLMLVRDIPDESFNSLLVEFTTTKNLYHGRYALEAIAQSSSPEAQGILKEFLKSEKMSYREIAVCYFALKKDPIAIEPLIEMFTDQYMRKNSYLYAALKQYPDNPRAVEFFKSLENDEDPEIRELTKSTRLQIPA